jgi:hypothetical protein
VLLLDPDIGQPPVLDVDVLRATLDKCRWPGAPSKEGRFSTTLPRIDGLVIAGIAPGWKAAHQRVGVARRVERAYVDLRLEPAVTIRGVLRSDDGAPIRGVSVTIYSHVAIPAEEMNDENLRLFQPQGGFTGRIDLVTGKARAKFIAVSRTDEKGRFDVSVAVDGEAVLVAYAPGHRPVELDLGYAPQSVEDLALQARRVRNPTDVRLVLDERSLANVSVLVCDLSLKDGDIQPGRNARTDADGRISTDWFVPDRFYHFAYITDVPVTGSVLWRGQAEIDLARDLRDEMPER